MPVRVKDGLVRPLEDEKNWAVPDAEDAYNGRWPNLKKPLSLLDRLVHCGSET